MKATLIPENKKDFEATFKKHFERAKILNSELTELEFFNRTIDDLIKENEFDIPKVKDFYNYLVFEKKANCIKWELKDYLNQYLQTKQFGFIILRDMDFDLVVDKLKTLKIQFEYIYSNLLNGTEKNRFKDDYFDFLDRFLANYKETRFKTIIEKHKAEILEFIPKISKPKATNSTKDTGEVKEKYNEIFSDNNFEVWELLFNELEVKESSRTDLRFMYEVMKAKGQILGTVRLIDYTDWVNDLKTWKIGKLQYTKYKDTSNSKRYRIYRNIMQLK